MTPILSGAAPVSIAVLLPHTPAPYRDIFLGILGCTGASPAHRVRRLMLGDAASATEAAAWLAAHPTDVLITLGQDALDAALALPPRWPLVAGAVYLEATQCASAVAGISLHVAPHAALARLQGLVPTLERVHAVYQPGVDEGRMREAEQAAQAVGLVLRAYPYATGRGSRVDVYRELLSHQPGRHDAIWLYPQLNGVEEVAILPLLLGLAWRRQMVLFSENPAHVSLGVLCAVVPDYVALGERLTRLALARHAAPATAPAIAALEDIALLINVRTAARLDIPLARRARRGHLALLAEGLVVD